MKIVTGDLMHVYASFASDLDYTCRLILKLKDPVDGALLEKALRNTEKRYPYFSVHMRKNDSEYYYEPNPSPVALINTDKKITLNEAEANEHVWAVCYQDDRIFLDFYHGIADGTGLYMVLATLLYYYCNERYGVTDHAGIHTLDDPVLPEETADPLADLPPVRLEDMPNREIREAFSIIRDGGAAPRDPHIYHVEIPEPAFVRFMSASDSTPGTMISLLLLRALEARYPGHDKPLVGSYVVNARPMLRQNATYHNCLTSLKFDYDERLQKLPFSLQTTVFRGVTFLKSDEDVIRSNMASFASYNRALFDRSPSLEEKKTAFAELRSSFLRSYTSIVSYVGKWKFPALGEYVEEFWTHAPLANNCLCELSAVGGKICIALHLRSESDDLFDLFLKQLRQHGIPYKFKGIAEHDTPVFKEPGN